MEFFVCGSKSMAPKIERRAFLRETAGALGGLTGWPLIGFGTETASRAAEIPTSHSIPEDEYHAPEWLRYARAVYFEGYGPPLYPHMRDFDAKRLVEIVLELGGNTLRFQPIGFRAYYPSKVFPVHPELGNRDLIDE